jgi:hypothetical protein
MIRFGWQVGSAMIVLGLVGVLPVRAADTEQERKQLDVLQGYDQLRGEKNIKQEVENVPNQPVETVIIWADAKPTNGTAPLTVAFSADPPDGVSDPVYAWQFSDGGTGTGQSVSHTFDKPGIYRVLLKVSNASGALGEDELRIKVK